MVRQYQKDKNTIGLCNALDELEKIEEPQTRKSERKRKAPKPADEDFVIADKKNKIQETKKTERQETKKIEAAKHKAKLEILENLKLDQLLSSSADEINGVKTASLSVDSWNALVSYIQLALLYM